MGSGATSTGAGAGTAGSAGGDATTTGSATAGVATEVVGCTTVGVVQPVITAVNANIIPAAMPETWDVVRWATTAQCGSLGLLVMR